MFGNTQSQPWGQSATQGSSLFGGQPAQQPSAFGGSGTTAFGGAQPQASSFGGGGAFGQSQPAQNAGFGGQQQQQTSQWGASTQGASTAWGQNQSSGFGQTPTQSTSAFGGGGLFGGSSQPQGGTGFGAGGASSSFGAFGQTTSQFGSQPQQPGAFGQQPQQPGFGGAPQQQGGAKFYRIEPDQQINTQPLGPFNGKLVVIDDGKSSKQNLTFKSLRVEDKLGMASQMMLRFYDQKAQATNQPQENPEWQAKMQFQQNVSQYPLLSQIQDAPGAGGMNPQASSAFGQTGTGFGAPASSAPAGGLFGQPQQQSTGFGAFGQTQPTQASTGFGQQPQNQFGQQASQPFGQAQPATGGGLFGSQQPSQGVSPFGQPNQPAPNAGGSSLFGQTSQQPSSFGQAGGLFGGQSTQPQQQQPSAGGLFGQSQPAQSSGGLFGKPATPAQQPTSGGLFGNTAQPSQPNAGGGLFGNNTAQAKPAGGGLFGGTSTTPAPGTGGGGLFGQPAQAPQQQPAGGSLFGGQAQNQAKPAGGGLFGSTTPAQPQPAAGGLFGQSTQPAPAAGGGLFGNNQAKPAGSSLFGGGATSTAPAPAAGGGLFGNPAQSAGGGGLFGNVPATQTPSAGGGLFGAPAQQPAQASGGLFGAKPAQPAAGGLFGAPSATPARGSLFGGQTQTATAQPGGSLFGGQTQQVAGQPQPQMQAINVYSQFANDPYGLANSTVTDTDGLKPLEDELNEIKQSMARFKEGAEKNALKVGKLQIGGQVNLTTGDILIPATLNLQMSKEQNEEYLMGLKQQEIKRKMKNRHLVDRSKPIVAQHTYSMRHGHQLTMESPSKFQITESKPLRVNRRQQQPERIQPDDERVPRSTWKGSRVSSSIEQEPQPNLLTVHFNFVDSAVNGGSTSYTHVVHKSHGVQELFKFIEKKLDRDHGIAADQFKLLFASRLLQKSSSFEEAGIESEATLQIVLDSSYKEPTKVASTGQKRSAPAPAPTHVIDEEDLSFLPKPPIQGYTCDPPILKLTRMSKEELQNLPSFKIQNHHGSIQFLVPEGKNGIDLTGVDLSDFEICSNGVKGYLRNEHLKPAVGCKLNVPSIATLFNIDVPDNQTAEQIEAILKNALVSSRDENLARGDDFGDPEFISYSHAQRRWVFKIPHFSQWGFNLFQEKSSVVEQQSKAMSDAPAPKVPASVQHSERRFRPDCDMHQSVQAVPIHRAQEQAPQPPAPRRQDLPVYTRLMERKKIKERLQQKKDLINSSDKDYYIVRPPLTEACAQLPGKGAGATHMSLRGTKPIFRPIVDADGKVSGCQLMTVEQKAGSAKLHLSTIPGTEDKGLDLTHLVLNHFRKDREANSNMEDESESGSHPRNIDFVSDKFIQSLLSRTDFPHCSAENTPSGIYRFLRDVAQALVKSSPWTEQTDFDFSIICLLNALLGDPRVHLHLLHPKANGALMFQKQDAAATEYVDQRLSISVSKQRRNALAELLRFICKTRFPVIVQAEKSDEALYQTAFKLLLNGQIIEAVRTLQQHGKGNLALIISRSVTASGLMKDQIRSLESAINLQSPALRNIYSLLRLDGRITEASSSITNLIIGQASPYQALCHQLLFGFQQQDTLPDILQLFFSQDAVRKASFARSAKGSIEEDLFFVLLRYFSGKDCQSELEQNSTPSVKLLDFKGVRCSTRTNSTSDAHYGLKWIVHASLMMYSRHLVHTADLSDPHLPGSLSSEAFQLTTLRLIDYLAEKGDFNQALALAATSLESFPLRRQYLFKLCERLVATYLTTKVSTAAKKETEDLLKTLGVPQSFVKVNQALYLVAHGHKDAALKLWLETKHLEAAAEIFVKDLSPLFFGSETALESLQKTELKKNVRIEDCRTSVSEFVAQPRRNYVDSILIELEVLFANSGEYHGGFSRAAILFKKVLDVIDEYQRIKLLQKWDPEAFEAQVKQINDIFKEFTVLRFYIPEEVTKAVFELHLKLEADLKGCLGHLDERPEAVMKSHADEVGMSVGCSAIAKCAQQLLISVNSQN